MSYEDAHAFEDEAASLGVSKVARSARGFMRAYEKHRTKAAMWKALVPGTKGQPWALRRQHFIERHLAQYKKKATHRRRLALIMWAYDPEQTGTKTPGKEKGKGMADDGIDDIADVFDAPDFEQGPINWTLPPRELVTRLLERLDFDLEAGPGPSRIDPEDADHVRMELVEHEREDAIPELESRLPPPPEGGAGGEAGQGIRRRRGIIPRSSVKDWVMAHIGDRPYMVPGLAIGRGSISDEDAQAIAAEAPLFRALAKASKSDAVAILSDSVAEKHELYARAARMALQHAGLTEADADRAREYVDAAGREQRAKVMRGSGFWDTMRKVAGFAVKHVLPVAIKALPLLL